MGISGHKPISLWGSSLWGIMIMAILNCPEDLPCWSVLKCFGYYKVDHKNHVSWYYHNVRQHLEHEWREVHLPVDFQFIINMMTETEAMGHKFHEEAETLSIIFISVLRTSQTSGRSSIHLLTLTDASPYKVHMHCDFLAFLFFASFD